MDGRASAWLGVVLLAASVLTAWAPAAEASHPKHATWYVVGIAPRLLYWPTGPVCYVPLYGSPPVETEPELFGACALTPPTEPRFRVTVDDYLGNPVGFSWGAELPNDGGWCDWGSGVGSGVFELRAHCRGVHIRVSPHVGGWLGRITLSAA